MPVPKLKPEPHVVIQFILDRCKYPRHEVAKRIGITRKTLHHWEQQLTNVRDGMVEKVSTAAEYPLERIPNNVIENAANADTKRRKQRATRAEQKRGALVEEPHEPKSDYDAQVKADRAREERQAAKANDPKRHRIRNHGTPTKANRNPRTYSQFSTAMTDIVVKGRDIPSDMEYPDLVAAALSQLGFYEAVYVPAHTIPYVTGNARATLPYTRRTYPAFYWKRPNGVQSMADTIDEAKARIAQQIAEDEAATADLI